MGAGIVYLDGARWNIVRSWKSDHPPFLVTRYCGLFQGILLCWVWHLDDMPVSLRVNQFVLKASVIAAGFMALSHGMNDARNYGNYCTGARNFFIKFRRCTSPVWVKIACATVSSPNPLRNAQHGGWKIIKTMGHKIFKMQPVRLCRPERLAGVIMSASLFGAPISTTQVISSSILGGFIKKVFRGSLGCCGKYGAGTVYNHTGGSAGWGAVHVFLRVERACLTSFRDRSH